MTDYRERERPPSEVTTYNMNHLDILAIHEMRMKVHDLYFQSVNDPGSLLLCFEALRQMFLPYQMQVMKNRRIYKEIEISFLNWRRRYDALMESRTSEGKIDGADYSELRERLYNLEVLLYHAKFSVGLAIKTERAVTDEDRMDQRMGVKKKPKPKEEVALNGL